MKSFLKYPGGKSQELPLVEKYKPEYIERYFEPFLGGGSIFFGLNEKNNYLNDYSKDLILLYTMIKIKDKLFFDELKKIDKMWKLIETEEVDFKEYEINKTFEEYFHKMYDSKMKKFFNFEKEGLIVSDDDKRSMIVTAKKTAFYMLIRDNYNLYKNDERHAAYYYFLREYCYSSMFRFSKNGNFNVPYGGRSYDKKYLTEKINYMYEMVNVKLKDAEIFNLDFETFLNRFDLNVYDFIFLDPPYDSEFSTYDKNNFDQSEQMRLASFLKKTKAKWMLIIKKTDFIYDLYKDFNILIYDMNYMVSFKNRNERNVEHLLITNYRLEV